MCNKVPIPIEEKKGKEEETIQASKENAEKGEKKKGRKERRKEGGNELQKKNTSRQIDSDRNCPPSLPIVRLLPRNPHWYILPYDSSPPSLSHSCITPHPTHDADRQTDRSTDRQIDRQIDRQNRLQAEQKQTRHRFFPQP